MWKIIIGVLTIVILGAGGYFYYKSTKSQSANDSMQPTVTVSEEPTATPTPEEVNKSEFTIRILNGSGIVGEAGRAKDLLEGGGFTIDSTGNADNYDYADTVIQAGDTVKQAWVDSLKESLGTKYNVKSSTETIADGVEADVVVIIGKLDKDGDSMVVEETNTPTPKEESSTTITPSPSVTPSPSPKGV